MPTKTYQNQSPDHLLRPYKAFLKRKTRSGTSVTASFCMIFEGKIFPLLYFID